MMMPAQRLNQDQAGHNDGVRSSLGLGGDLDDVELVQDILAGGASACADAGIPVLGGHSIDTPEPIYGLVALGLVHPDKVLKNATARAGAAAQIVRRGMVWRI